MMHRKILITLALAGTATYLVAQAISPRTKVGGSPSANAPGASAQGGAAMAKHSATGGNAAQQMLQHLISLECNYRLEKAKEENRTTVIGPIIEAQCYHVLTTMSPEQKKNEVTNIWEVDKYRPGGQWDHITAAPQRVRALLNLTPDQNKAIAAIADADWAKRMAPYDAITKRLTEKGLTGNDHAAAYRVELERYWAGKPLSYRGLTAIELFEGGAKKAREKLTPEQRNEWDIIVAAYKSDIKLAFEGSKPSFAAP